MTNKKLTKAQKKAMLLDAVLIAEGEKDPTPDMSYIQAWQFLVDTGEVWKLQGWFGRAAFRMISQGTIVPPLNDDEQPQDNGDEQ
jgi:hypothetical protein